jgi:tRNA modification GTPase
MEASSLFSKDTIVAPATPPGEGGIGIVRLSGPEAEGLLKRFFSASRLVRRLESHHLYHGRLAGKDGGVMDEVMAVLMRAPRSYTREDVAEIHCHGGGLLVRRIIDLFIDAGARLARPGEFTLRAFLNGRIDLTRAEAVIDLIRARSQQACEVAISQLGGGLARRLGEFRQRLADMLVQVEAAIDFPEEALDLVGQEKLGRKAGNLLVDMDAILDSFEAGRLLREGLSILIVGRPNVGKSSLMNALLGEARAIVTEIPGTTRDTIEEDLVLGGLPVRLVDTAGVRETRDPVELEGVRRARAKVETADLVLLVVDGSVAPDGDDLLALEMCRQRDVLLVVNKSDLASLPLGDCFEGLPRIFVSAREGDGLLQLHQYLRDHFFRGVKEEGRETVMLTERRHRQALVRAREAVGRFRGALAQEMSPEFGALDLRESLEALGEITGETTPDDILDKIFTRFCVGK